MADKPTLEEFMESARLGRPQTLLQSSTVSGPNPFMEAAAEAREEDDASGSPTRLTSAPGNIDTARTLFEIAGSLIGGPVGARIALGRVLKSGASQLATRAGQFAGRVAGAGSGAAAGTTVARGDEGVEESASRAAAAFGLGAGGEVVAPVLSKALTPVARAGVALARRIPVLRRLVDPLQSARLGTSEVGADDAMDIIESRAAAERATSVTGGGPTITTGQALDAPLLDTVERAIEGSFLGSGPMRATRRSAEDVVQGAVQEFAETFTKQASRVDQGRVLTEALRGSAAIHRRLTRVAHRKVDRMAGGILVDIRQVKRIAKDRFGESAKRRSHETIRRTLEDLDDTPDFVTFEAAQSLRSELLAIGRSSNEALPAATQSFGGKMAQLVDRRIVVAARELGTPEAIAAWREANSLTRMGKETFNESFIGGLLRNARMTPEQIYQGIIQANRPTKIREVREILFNPRFREAVGDPDQVWRGVQGQWISDAMAASVNPKTGAVEGRQLLGRLKAFGAESLSELFPGGKANELQKLAAALMRTQEKAGAGAAPFMFLQASALVGIAFTDRGLSLDTPEAAILLGPAALSVALTRPAVVNFLVRGATGEALGREAGRLLGQLGARLSAEGIPYEILKPDGSKERVDPPPNNRTSLP